MTPDQAAAQAFELFYQQAPLCDGTQPNKVARTTIEPGPASLAKSLPAKSVNPTCSEEGMASKLETKNRALEVVALNSPKSVECTRAMLDNSETKAAALSGVNMPAESKKKNSRDDVKSINVDKPLDSSRSNELSNIEKNDSPVLAEKILPNVNFQSDSNMSSVSSLNSVSNSRRTRIPRQIYANNVLRQGYPRVIKCRMMRSEMKGDKSKRKNATGRKIVRRKRIGDSRRVGKRQLQTLVRKLVVLTLYLRYLEVKRSSRRMRDYKS